MSYHTIASAGTGKRLPWDELRELAVPQLRIHGCGFSPRIENWSTNELITAPFWCLWCALNTGSWIKSDKKRWELGPECIVLKPPPVIYSRHSVRPMKQLWLHFSLAPDYVFEARSPYTIPVDPLLREQISALIDIYDATHDDSARVLYHHATALINSCFARHPLPIRHLPDALRTVLHRIENAPHEDLSNGNLAKMVGMSTNSFITWFESFMNTPPAAYVRDVRYLKACRMLAFSDLSIEQIAVQLGYPNRHYFSRVFAKRTGSGPAAFRIKCRENVSEDRR